VPFRPAGAIVIMYVFLVYHNVMSTPARLIDEHGATLEVVTTRTPQGNICLELKIVCPKDHPTGVTTALLRNLTASDLQRKGRPTQHVAIDNFLSTLNSPKWSKGSRNTLSDKDLCTLAALYERSLREGAPPTKTIQEWMGCSKPTASRAVKQARDAGFLGKPTKKGLPSTPRNNRSTKSDGSP
jgi:hypothetical protein